MQVLLGQAWGRAGDPAWLVLDRGPPLAPCRVPGGKDRSRERGYHRNAAEGTLARTTWWGAGGSDSGSASGSCWQDWPKAPMLE